MGFWQHTANVFAGNFLPFLSAPGPRSRVKAHMRLQGAILSGSKTQHCFTGGKKIVVCGGQPSPTSSNPLALCERPFIMELDIVSLNWTVPNISVGRTSLSPFLWRSQHNSAVRLPHLILLSPAEEAPPALIYSPVLRSNKYLLVLMCSYTCVEVGGCHAGLVLP